MIQGLANISAGAAAVSAAMLTLPGCGRAPEGAEERSPVRRAAFRAAAARDLLQSCFAGRGESEPAMERFDQLRRLAQGKRAAIDIAAGENEWRAVRLRSPVRRCPGGEAAYAEAFADYSRGLDALAAELRDHREE